MQVHFTIDGQWLTNTLRDRFWLENQPIETIALDVEDIIQDETSQTTIDNVTKDILSFDKKFVTNDDGTLGLIDDEQNMHRDISKKSEENKHHMLIDAITKDIYNHPLMYIDYWTTIKNVIPIIKYVHDNRIKLAPENVEYWLLHDVGLNFSNCFDETSDDTLLSIPSERQSLMNGCWLLHSPQLISHYVDKPLSLLTPNLRKEFWDSLSDGINVPETLQSSAWKYRTEIYKRWQATSDKEKQLFINLYNERTTKAVRAYEYLLPGAHAAIKAGKVIDQEILLNNATKDVDAVVNLLLKTKKGAKYKKASDSAKKLFDKKVQETLKKPLEPSDTVTQNKHKEISTIGTSFEPGISDDEYEKRTIEENGPHTDLIAKPSTKLDTWESLISPDGTYYPCGFGIHNGAAYALIKQHPSWFMIFDKQDNIVASNREAVFLKSDIFDIALDIILANGWIAIRQMPCMGEYMSTGNSVPNNIVAKERHIKEYNLTPQQKMTLEKLCDKFDVKTLQEK